MYIFKPAMLAIYSIFLLALSTGTQAELVKWVDAKGNTHYGESAPAGANKQQIDRSGLSTMKAQDSNGGLQELSQNYKAEQELEQRETEKQALATQKEQRQQQRCASLKKNLKTMRKQAPIYTTDDNGKRQYLSDEQRQKDISKAVATLKKYCS